jgi:hypothetical protein
MPETAKVEDIREIMEREYGVSKHIILQKPSTPDSATAAKETGRKTRSDASS